jgi:hypothetical protein
MKRFVAVMMMCLGFFSGSHARDFEATGSDYGYAFSDVPGWIGIGQDLETFPQADMVFYAAERNGGKVHIRYAYTDVYIYTNVTSGQPEELSRLLEEGYREESPNLKVVRAKDIGIGDDHHAKVTYYLNVTSENKAQVVASIPGKRVFVSLVMTANSERLLRENLPDFEKLLLTYREREVESGEQ